MASDSVSPGRVLGDLLPEGMCDARYAARPITGLSLDSRRIAAGDLFIALPGTVRDGRDFISLAIDSGCAAVIAEENGFDNVCPGADLLRARPDRARIPLITIDSLARRVSDIAARFYGQPGREMTVFGVTGTNGKTTCTALISQLCSLVDGPSAVVGTLGCGVVTDGVPALAETGMTTPDAVELQRILADLRASGSRTVAMEVSSHSLDQHRVDGAAIDCAVFTNLSRDHLDYHGTEAAYAAAKARLFHLPGISTAVINRDDPFGRVLLAELPSPVHGFSYGYEGEADITLASLELGADGIRGRVVTPWGQGDLECPLIGPFNASNLLAVIGALCAAGMDLTAVLEKLPQLRPVPGRMEPVAPENRPRVIVDYAHTPDALEKTLRALAEQDGGRLWCVFGCGGDRDRGKRPLMARVAETHADRVVVTSDNPRHESPEAILDDIRQGFDGPGAVIFESDRRTAIRRAIALADAADTVLIAGKGHEAYQQVGDSRHPFSDRDEALAALRERLADETEAGR